MPNDSEVGEGSSVSSTPVKRKAVSDDDEPTAKPAAKKNASEMYQKVRRVDIN